MLVEVYSSPTVREILKNRDLARKFSIYSFVSEEKRKNFRILKDEGKIVDIVYVGKNPPKGIAKYDAATYKWPERTENK